MIIHTTLSCTYFPCLLVGSITQVSALKHPHSVHLPTIGWASNKSPLEMSSPFWFGKPKATHDALMIIHSILPVHIPCLPLGWLRNSGLCTQTPHLLCLPTIGWASNKAHWKFSMSGISSSVSDLQYACRTQGIKPETQCLKSNFVMFDQLYRKKYKYLWHQMSILWTCILWCV